MANPVPNSGYTQGVIGGEAYPVTTSTALKTTDGHLVGIWVSTAGTIGVYNGTGTNGVAVASSFAVTAGFWYPMPFHMTNGTFINVVGGTPAVTVSLF